MTELTIKTTKAKEIIDITDRVQELLSGKESSINLFLLHTTAALTTADLDPGGTDQDYLDAFEKIVPKLAYRHPHNPEHMPDHILSSMIGTSLTLPVKDGKLLLGTWQRVVLIEFDGPRERKILIS
ncbi:MAG: secondary thiamine-phosphate synthase enzyme YjbQ [Candidatus Colwellbacteria bacterium]